MDWLAVLNNREWAILVWLTIFVILASRNKQIRISFKHVLKAFFAKPIIISLVLMLCYIVLMIFGLSYIGLWDMSQLKNTLVWIFTVGIVAMFGISKIDKEDHYFRNAVLENIKLTAFVEYLVNLYVFSLPVELVLFPTILFLAMMLAIAKTEQKYQLVEKVLNGILSILGIILLVYITYSLYNHFENFATISNVKDFSVPVILSILFLPFVYAALVYTKYENLFIRLRFFIHDPVLRTYSRRQIVLQCRLNLKMLDRFAKKLIHQRPTTRQEVQELLNHSKQAPLNETAIQSS